MNAPISPEGNKANQQDGASNAYEERLRRLKELVASKRVHQVEAEPENPEKSQEEKSATFTSDSQSPLPYLDRDDDELVPDPNNPGQMIMKKYLNI